MRNVLWICAAVASALTLADARAEGDGLSADADRVPWARFQSRIAYAPGAPGWRADLAPLRADRPAGRQRRPPRRRLFRLDAGRRASLAPAAFAPPAACSSARAAPGSARSRRRRERPARDATGACSAPRPAPLAVSGRSAVDSATVPYIGIGYSGLSAQERLELQRRPRRRLAEPRQRGPLRPRLRRLAEPRRRRPRHAPGAGRPARRLVFLLNRSPGVCR